MAKRLTSEQQYELLDLFDSGKYTPADLARKFQISPSTVSRHLKRNNREIKTKESHQVLINEIVKSKLRRVMSGYGISNPDFLISQLDKEFTIQLREKEERTIFYV